MFFSTCDASDRMLSAVSGRYTNTVGYAYDDGGRKSSESLTIAGQTYTTLTSYNVKGQLTGYTYPDGTSVERYAYSAYGTPTITNASGTVLTTSAENNRYTYTGREWDDEISLYHYRARMYDPLLGRFCSRDPIQYRSFAWNMYEYVEGVPLVNIDPSGTVCQKTTYKGKPDLVTPGGFPIATGKMAGELSKLTERVSKFLPGMKVEFSYSGEGHVKKKICDVECCDSDRQTLELMARAKFELALKGGFVTPIAGVPVYVSGSISGQINLQFHGIEETGGCQPRRLAFCGSVQGAVQGKICVSPTGRIFRKLLSVCVKAKGSCTGGKCTPVSGGAAPSVSNCKYKMSIEACGLFMCNERDFFVCDSQGCRFVNPLPAYW